MIPRGRTATPGAAPRRSRQVQWSAPSSGGPEPVPEVSGVKPYSVPSAGRRGLLRLDFNENLRGPSPRVLRRLRRLDADDLALYPDETSARAAVSRRFEIEPPLDLVLTSGIDEGIRLVCDAFVRPAERVLILEPGYPLYRFYASLAGATVRGVEYGPGIEFPARSRVLRAAEGCRLVILGDPNNPTGTPLPPGLIESLCRRQPGSLVLADEAYAEFAEQTSIPLLRRFPNLIVARTFSKAYGLAGLRAGVLLGRRECLSWIARMRSPYAVGSVALLALETALEDEAYVRRYVAEVRESRAALARGLAEMGVRSWPSAANFLIARFGARAAALREALKRRGILVRDRSDHPSLAGTLRIGIGTPEQTRRALEAIGESIREIAGEAR